MFTAAVLCADYAGTLDLLDTTSLLVQSSTPAPVITVGTQREKIAIGANFLTAPVGRLTLRNHQWAYTLSYSPSLAVPDVEVGLSRAERRVITNSADVFQIVHAGAASATWHDRFVIVSLTEAGSYGQSFVYQALTASTQTTVNGQTTPVVQPTSPTPIETPPTTTPSSSTGANGNVQSGPIGIFSSNTSGNVSLHTGPRTFVSLAGGFSVGGALKSSDQQFLPLQYGWLVSAGVNHASSVRDNFGVSVLAEDTTTSGACIDPKTAGQICVEQSPYGQAQATLTHRLSALASLSFALGVGAYEVTGTNLASEAVVLPVGSVTASYSPRGEATFLLGAGLAPTIDLLTGLPSYRLQTTLSVAKPLTHTLTVTVLGGFLKSIPSPSFIQGSNAGLQFEDTDNFIAETGSVNANVRIDRARTIGFGVDELYQFERPNTGTGTGTTMGTGVGATYVGSADAHVNIGINRQLGVGAGLVVSWQRLTAYTAVVGVPVSTAPSTGGYISVTGTIPTLRF